MKKLAALILLSLTMIPFAANAQNRSGYVQFQNLPSCVTGTGSIINYNPSTGAFSCNAVTGQTLTWTATQTFGIIGGYLAKITTQTGTTYTLTSNDCGTKILFTNASAVTVTLPNSLAIGCEVMMTQNGAGKVSPTAGSGATLHIPHSFTGTAAQYSTIGVAVDTNAGNAAVYSFVGDGA